MCLLARSRNHSTSTGSAVALQRLATGMTPNDAKVGKLPAGGTGRRVACSARCANGCRVLTTTLDLAAPLAEPGHPIKELDALPFRRCQIQCASRARCSKSCHAV
jgi:hypothetical protein